MSNAALYLPLFHWVEYGQNEFALIVAISLPLLLLAAFLSHDPATYPEIFTTAPRATVFGILYALAIALFGGTAGYVMPWVGNPTQFAWYSIALLVVSHLP